MATTQKTEGKIVQCIGAVIDIQFPRDAMPKVYDALQLVEEGNSFAEKGLTFEVEQQLGDGVVRTIALGSSDGLRRGMKVKATGAPVTKATVQTPSRGHCTSTAVRKALPLSENSVSETCLTLE